MALYIGIGDGQWTMNKKKVIKIVVIMIFNPYQSFEYHYCHMESYLKRSILLSNNTLVLSLCQKIPTLSRHSKSKTYIPCLVINN